MKPIRLLSLILILALLLPACNYPDSDDNVTFFYPRNPQQKIIPGETFYATEERETTGHSTNLRYLISLYLQGPLDHNTVSPFPAGTRLVDLDLHAGQLYVQLSQEFGQLSGIDLTVACTCFSLTCFYLTDVDRVTIITPASGDRPAVEITLSREDLTLTDNLMGESP